MQLRDISISGFFRILFLVWTVFTILTIGLGIFMFTFFPGQTNFNLSPETKILGIITLSLDDSALSFIFLAIIVMLNAMVVIWLKACTIKFIADHTMLGNIKVATARPVENVFE